MDDAIVKNSLYSLEVEVSEHIFACHFAGRLGHGIKVM
jgi:hypothetical protein